MKQAVILAAGAGVRLGAAANGAPKCLLSIGGHTLIEHQLCTLRRLGIVRICVVVGHRARQVQDVIGDTCDVIVNESYAETNSLYSLLLTRDWISDSFILLNGDVLAHQDIYHRIIAVDGSALAYDSTSGDSAEHMKACVQDGWVRALGKDLDAAETHGESLGILQFSKEAVPLLFEEAESLIHSGHRRCWAPAAVDRIARCVPIRAIDVAGLPWIEIDYPEDLVRAQCTIWPSISDGCWMASPGEPEGVALKRVS